MKKLHLICNAHLDPIWQWTWDEGIAAAISTFQSAADLADDFDYIFCHNEALLYEAVEKNAPELFAKIQSLVKAGKWAISGGWYLQPDCNLPCGEGFVRQIKIGQKYFLEKFGVKPTVATNYDSFGHSLGLVQIMRKCGYQGYLICRPKPTAQFNYPSRFFEWISPDGSSIVASSGGSYMSTLGKATEKIQKAANGLYVGMIGAEDDVEGKPTTDETDYVLWGVGNHGGGPSRKDLGDIESLTLDGAELLHSTPEALFKDGIRVEGEVRQSIENCMPGCYSSMVRVKQAYREAENNFFATEKLLSVAKMHGYKVDLEDFAAAEKKLLLAQFHDILPGTLVEDAEKDALDILGMANKIAGDYRSGAFLYLALQAGKAQEGEYPVCVFNYMPYAVKTPIEVEFMLADKNWSEDMIYVPHVFCDGKEIPSQKIKEASTINLDWRKRIVFEAELKPLGITRFSVYFEKEKVRKPCAQNGLNLQRYTKLLKGRLKLEIYDDSADPWAMSNEELKRLGKNPKEFRLMTGKQAASFCRIDREISPIHTVEDGEVLTAVEALYTAGKTNGVIEYRFYKNQPFVDLKVTLEFSDKNKLVRLKIPAPCGIPIGDGPYITEEKPPDGKEAVFQKWFGVKEASGEIFAVINDGVYSGKFENGYIYLTLLRGSGYCFHPIGERELYPQDRYLPRIESGRYVYNLRICRGNLTEVSAQAELFNQKPYAVNVFPTKYGEFKHPLKTDRELVMPVLKIGSNEGYVARFYNPETDTRTFSLDVFGNKRFVSISPHEVLSARIVDEDIILIRDDMPI